MRETFVDTATVLLDEDPRTAAVLADISAAAFEPAARQHPVPGRHVERGGGGRAA
jgi:transketolase